jgi:SAM-dependent methyltransferase
MSRARADDVRERVRAGYTAVAERAASCCGAESMAAQVARRVGYSEAELRSIPEGANLGVGCGNPTALAELRAGEVVLDRGCGAGFGVFLAAHAVGPTGRVIGVDMTEAMLERARENARRGSFSNVAFLAGTIEALPLPDASVGVVVSSCVINLSPDKPRVFREALRVLRPGGRLAVSDLVLEEPLPPPLRESIEAWVGCLAGALLREDYLDAIRRAGFLDVRVVGEASHGGVIDVQTPEIRAAAERAGLGAEQLRRAVAVVTSVKIAARRRHGA